MSKATLALACTALLTTAASLPAAASGPALATDPATLERAIRCPVSFSGAHEPVLLVHGTAGRPEDHWALGYQKILPEMGFDVCTVRLPNFGLDDIQAATEYVVHAVRVIAAASGKSVDIVGYSQGGLEPRWAVKWWPDVAAAVDDLVTLASPHHGAASADASCAGGSCAEAIWQMNQASLFLAKLNETDETLDGIDYTSIYSLNDELVQPVVPPTAELSGAANILVQDVCPGRPVSHGQQPVDAVVFALTVDALAADGPGDPARIDPATCDETFLPGLTLDDGLVAAQVVYGNGGEAVALDEGTTDSEPELRPYALPEAAGVAGLGAALLLLARLRARRRDA